MLSNSFVYGQLKNFGTKAKYKPEPNYHYSVYGYYDVIRESGIGFQFQVGGWWNLDASAYLINKHYSLSSAISQWDYYDLTGYGFSFKPKLLLSRLGRFYLGANFACEFLQHDKIWVNYYNWGDYYIRQELQSAKGVAYTFGFTLGGKIAFNRYFAEPFAGMGFTLSDNIKETTFQEKYGNPYSTYPHTENYNHGYFQLNLGVKLGLSFKKNKKHEAIDKKFDEIYIPKSMALTIHFETLDLSGREAPKHLKRALARYEALDRNALRAYKRNYFDSTEFYNKMDFLFNRIEDLIFNREQ
jgi:hypothetical protein